MSLQCHANVKEIDFIRVVKNYNKITPPRSILPPLPFPPKFTLKVCHYNAMQISKKLILSEWLKSIINVPLQDPPSRPCPFPLNLPSKIEPPPSPPFPPSKKYNHTLYLCILGQRRNVKQWGRANRKRGQGWRVLTRDCSQVFKLTIFIIKLGLIFVCFTFIWRVFKKSFQK